jgi:hypothetical protein
MVADLVRDLCGAIESPVQRRGRPRLPVADAVFAVCMKVYGVVSGRRSMTDMREFEAKGLIDQAPHYSRIFEHLENPALTPILQAMIEESARPLKSVESDFAVDSTGFSIASASGGLTRSMAGSAPAATTLKLMSRLVYDERCHECRSDASNVKRLRDIRSSCKIDGSEIRNCPDFRRQGVQRAEQSGSH